jgi:hypothetical protein
MAVRRIRVTVSPGWEIPTEAPPPRALVRANALTPGRVNSLRSDSTRRRREGVGPHSPSGRGLAIDPFVVRVLDEGRFELAGVRSARPRRGAAARAGTLTANIDAPDSAGWVLVVRHPSGALTFHSGQEGGKGARRFEIALAPPPQRRGPGTVVRVFFLKILGRVAGLALPVLARSWERRRFHAARAPLGLVRLSVRDGRLRAAPLRGGIPPSPGRSLLFVHGTFSHATAAFADLAASPGLFPALEARYEGRVFAFNHLTVAASPDENARDLLARLPKGPVLLDAVTHSRGGLVLRALARHTDRVTLTRVVLAASPNAGTPLASPARWDRLAGWVANLGEMFPGGALAFGLDFASEALVWMATRAGGALPGIAAMDPAGDFLEKLNAAAAPAFDAAAVIAR